MRWADEDRLRLLESRRDQEAGKNPADITQAVPLQGALNFLLDELGVARGGLLGAVKRAAKESNETQEARAQLFEVEGKTVAQHRWIKGRITEHFLNPPPDQPLTKLEMERRQKLVTSWFPRSTSLLERDSAEEKLDIIKRLIQNLGGNADADASGRIAAPTNADASGSAAAPERPDAPASADAQRVTDKTNALLALGDTDQTRTLASLIALAKDLDAADKHLNAEVTQDREATLALRDARVAYDEAAQLYAKQVEVALRRENRLELIGRFVRAQDPAWRSRRQSAVLADQEEGIQDINNELDDGY